MKEWLAKTNLVNIYSQFIKALLVMWTAKRSFNVNIRLCCHKEKQAMFSNIFSKEIAFKKNYIASDDTLKFFVT